ncbi:MAG: PSD1 and planctomycete cytochrome C domain-containing protein [Opitutaceae bacterium]
MYPHTAKFGRRVFLPQEVRRKIAFYLTVVVLAGFSGLDASSAEAGAQKPAELTKENTEFFESRIRPVLVERCYECHSTQAKRVRGGLLLDSQPGIAEGGANGPVIVPGDLENSPLIHAIRWTDSDFAMPPRDKLTAQQVENFEQWVKMGAPDPRIEAVSKEGDKAKTRDLSADRNWWAFRPVTETNAPRVIQSAWGKKRIDAFVLRALETKELAPSPQADPRSLIVRAYIDLTGLRPSYEEITAFAKDPSEKAYAAVVETLLASPHYGQRWGRYWLDVARFGEDNPTTEATTPPYPNAWRYRDWVIDAFNRDLPYDKFVSLQLAADVIPGTPRSDLAATGFLGAGPIYHKDGRLSKDVVENLYMDDWDERVDVVSRGVLGLTVACARCHDHKFDPISTRDYYSLAGVFASTAAAPRPLIEVDSEVETRFMATSQRLFYLSYVANLMRNEPGSSPAEARKKVERFVSDMDTIQTEIAAIRDKYPDLGAQLAKLERRPKPYPAVEEKRPNDPVVTTEVAAIPVAKEPAVATAKNETSVPPATGGLAAAKDLTVPLATAQPPPAGRQGRGSGVPADPYFHSVFEAGLWVDGTDPDLTMIEIKPGVARDLRVLAGGNVAKPGEISPRGFPTVLAKGDPVFHHGSGRQELAEKIFTDAAPLAARVIINRVWGWHFGRPLVATPSDFGSQGEKPTHPTLLDDLAARFIASGWSLKWLHREIMLSATYQQASRLRPDAAKLDPANSLMWRMTPRRLDIEAYRDGILQATGTLDPSMGGPSMALDQADNYRRTVYARISRGRVSNLLQLYDFPEATMHSPSRDTTVTPLQQLFVLNSPFMRSQAEALLASVAEAGDDNAKVRVMYRKALLRDADDRELTLATRYLATGTMADFAHALLSTNEQIFWP